MRDEEKRRLRGLLEAGKARSAVAAQLGVGPSTLHHVNGDGADNRLENLQLLCGNCHSQTDNWVGAAWVGDASRTGRRSKDPC